jgi:ADP-ribosyl-[dinitrogen reductase] hydrolase
MSNALLGGAIGDALGVFAESKLSNYQPLLDWDGKTFLGSEYHNLPPGCYSDDTMMSLCVAQSLIDNNGFNPDDLAKRYVELFTSNTIRGYGRTTKAAIDNLIAGKSYKESGIAGSYGNGSGMRVAPFSVYFRNDIQALIEAVKIDSAITHASEEAEAGALSIALAVYYIVNSDTDNLLEKILIHLPDSRVKSIIFSLSVLMEAKNVLPSQALSILGTKADIRMTAPSILYTYLMFDNYQDACETIIRCGGDTDTHSAIIASFYGAKYGRQHFSEYHVKNVEDSEKLIILDSQLYNKSGHSYFPT